MRLIAVMAAVVVASVVARPDAAAAKPCPVGTSIIQSTPSAVLYSTDNTIGCYRRTGRRTYLSDVDGGIYAEDPYRLVGRFTSAERTTCDRYTGSCYSEVAVWDLASASPPATVDGNAFDVELKANGTFAAIVQPKGSRTKQVVVYRWETNKPSVVDRGADIDPSSLSRNGRMVEWVRGGQVRRTRLR